MTCVKEFWFCKNRICVRKFRWKPTACVCVKEAALKTRMNAVWKEYETVVVIVIITDIALTVMGCLLDAINRF